MYWTGFALVQFKGGNNKVVGLKYINTNYKKNFLFWEPTAPRDIRRVAFPIIKIKDEIIYYNFEKFVCYNITSDFNPDQADKKKTRFWDKNRTKLRENFRNSDRAKLRQTVHTTWINVKPNSVGANQLTNRVAFPPEKKWKMKIYC